jgi:hypothetical protein
VAINIKFRVFAIKENALASKVCRGNIGAVALADRDKLRFFHSQVKKYAGTIRQAAISTF